MFSAYDLLFSAYGQVIATGYHNCVWTLQIQWPSIKRLKKNYYEWKITHGLHNMFYFERKKISCSIVTVFVHGYCLPQCSFFFLSIFSNCFLERRYLRCFILDVAGVLNPPQYAPTWIAYIFKFLAKDNNWSLWVQCMTITFDF